MKRLLTLLPVLVFCLFCAPAVLADTTTDVSYLDESGNTQTCAAATVVTASDTAWSDGWYVAQGDVTIGDSVTVSGDVKLILEDGASLTVNGSILVEENDRFSVYGQSADGDMGSLAVTASDQFNAAIGGKDGGTTGTVNLYGGSVSATNIWLGAAIGGGNSSTGGTVNIYGGTVNATTGGQGAAIGAGSKGQGCTVNIFGGNVTAINEDEGESSAIGGSYLGGTFTVNIYGGTVTASSNSSDGGAGIGCGYAGTGGTVNISGGTVTASSVNSDAVNGTVTVSPAAGTTLVASAGASEAAASPLAGSPFGTQTNITDLVKGQRWFHSEAVQPVSVAYLDENGTTQTCDAATVVTASDTAWSDGWYVAQGDVTINSSVTVRGDVNLILEDGASLTVNGSILVEENNRFSVYGQSAMGLIGSLNVTSSTYDAAIGGKAGGTTGTVNLYGGSITATSTGSGAAIGSGQKGHDGTVHIAGGFVKAVSQSRSAAIGGGEFSDGGTIQISGGYVTATSCDGAAIGAGAEMDTPTMSGGTLSISGGTVIATSTGKGPAIGGSGSGHGIDENDRVVLTGGTVIAQTRGAGIAIEGSSLILSGGTLTVSSANNDAITGTVTAAPAAGMLLSVSAGDCETAASPLAGSPFGTQTDITALVKGQHWFRSEAVQSASVAYLDENGTTRTCDTATVVTATGTTWSDGWYVVQGDVTIGDSVTVRGDVKLILEDGASLTVNGSILVDDPSTFSVYAQSTDSDTMGSLSVDFAGENASIGSSSYGTGGTVNIYGGNINAVSEINGAAIGGGESSSGFTVNIYGGNICAVSEGNGAAIGGGANGSGATVNISGGSVEATGNRSGAAIGGGDMGDSVAVTISGGSVEAISNLSGAAIGGGSLGSATVHISGGTVSASNTQSGSAIKGDSITLSGGSLTASSARFAALDGTVTVDPAAGMLFNVSAGDSEAAASPLAGSPFTAAQEITNLVGNQHWFRSEAVTLVSGITLDQTALTLQANGTATLTYTVSPDDASIPALRWTSSNEAVATVEDNTRASGMVVITAKGPGTAVITGEATDGSGVQVQCTVTVEAAPTPTPDSTDSSGNSGNSGSSNTSDSSSSSGSSGSVTPTATPVPETQTPTAYYTCPVCGTHNWTATDGGYRCDNCGYLETSRQLSDYGNVQGVYTPAAQTGSTDSTAAASSIPQTSDGSHPGLWLVLLTVSGLALGGLAIGKRKFPL